MSTVCVNNKRLDSTDYNRQYLKSILAVNALLLAFILMVPVAFAQDVTQEELEQVRVIDQELRARGLITTDIPAASLNIDIGEDRLLNFATYINRNFSVSGDVSATRANEIHPSGKKMYVVGRGSQNITEYTLGTDWDLSSASLSGELNLANDLGVKGHQEFFTAHGMYIRKDTGRSLWVFNRTEIWEYDLDTAWDIESARNPRYKRFPEIVRGHDFDFSPDGRFLYIDDRISGKVFQYQLSDQWKVETASFVRALDISSRQEAVRGIQFTDDGKRMFLLDTGAGEIYEYYLSSNFDISTAKYLGSFEVGNRADEATGLTFSPDFTRFYVSSENNNRIYQYKVSVVDEDESAIASNRQKVVANGEAAARITATARDRDGDAISGVRMSLTADGNSVNIQNVRIVTNNSGVATFDVSHTTEQQVEFRASGMGIDIDDRVTIEFTTVDQNKSSISVNREKVLANGSASATITVTAKDRDGDTLEGVDFNLIASGNTNVDIDQSESITDSDGIARFSVTSTSYGNTEFTAEGLGVQLSGVSVRFVDVDPDESEMLTESVKVLANNSAEGIITVIARDEDGDELEGARIRLRADSDHPDLDSSTVTTNAEGEATFKVRSSHSETVIFYAEASGNRLSQEVELQFVTVDPDQSAIAITPERVQADGEEISTISVTTRDEDGDILSGARVEIEALNGTSNISESNQITNRDGIAEFYLTNTRPQIVQYKIIAENKLLSDNSEVGYIPIAPVALSATSVRTRSFTSNWEVIDGAEYYLLDIATDSSFSTILPEYHSYDTGNRTSYDIESLSPGVTYMYRVRAVSDDLIGANSQTITTTTYPDTPEAVEATDKNALRFTANWIDAEGAESYRVDVARDADFESILPEYDNFDAGSDTKYTITNLEPGTRYFYRVRSVADPRTSENSNVSEATTLTISNEQSVIEAEQLRVLANGLQPNPVYITVKSDEGILLQDLVVDLTLFEGDAQIESVQGVTDENGIAVFNVTSTVTGSVVFNVSVAGIELGQLTFEFLPDNGILELGNNYPNPFLHVTTLPVTIPRQMNVNLQVYNAIGAPVRTVADEVFEAGYYEIPFQGSGLAAGVYFFRLTADGKVMTNKMLLIK